jgi:hypothetical protein|tara:strand:+ start:99 stop:716 length:618 start_codon:yes stop_codon:yes gene_type:complete
MNKENEKFLDKINNALLSAGKCAEDIVTPKMKGETPRETMAQAFLRRYEGREAETFTFGKVKVSHADLLHYMELIARPTRNRNFSICHMMGLEDITTLLHVGGYPLWGDLPRNSVEDGSPSKEEALWNLGFAVKHTEEDTEAAHFYIERKMYRGLDNRVRSGLVVVGTERTDKEWLSSGQASVEAHTFDRDYEVAKDLQMIAGMR